VFNFEQFLKKGVWYFRFMPRYDLFRIENGSPLWVGTVNTLEDANEQAKSLQRDSEFIVLDHATGHKLVFSTGQSQPDRHVESQDGTCPSN
jgi:hypothetical protein